MSVVLHASDPHFGTEQAVVTDALLQLVKTQKPDIAVLSGDITQRARRAQFRAARRFVDRLSAPVTLVLPGNHDIPLFNVFARMWYPYANYQRVFGPDLQPSFESEDLLVLSVNTTRPYRHVDGEISGSQIQQITERLRRASCRQLRLVVTHQPTHVTRPEDTKNLLHGYQQAIRAWAQAGADLLLGGHIHLPYISPLHQYIHDLERKMWAVQAGTAVSSRVRWRAPNSINVLRYGQAEKPRQCIGERWDYQASLRCFELVQSTVMFLDLDRRCN